jgi:hypothetical protein
MLKQSKLGNLFLAVGVVSGGIYAAKRGKPAMTIGLIALAAGFGGFIVGNALTKFYETP